jgi:hypothetical protein
MQVCMIVRYCTRLGHGVRGGDVRLQCRVYSCGFKAMLVRDVGA